MTKASAIGQQPKRRTSPKAMLKTVIANLGFEIRRASRGQAQGAARPSDSFDDVFRVVEDYTLVPREGLKSLYEQMAFCEKIALAGDYVECGVWKGGSVGVAALANLQHGKVRRAIHLFDAFDDICEPDATVDGDRAVREVREMSQGGGTQGRLVPVKGIYDRFGGHGTIDECRNLLEKRINYDPAQIHFHKGWFQDTLPKDSAAIKRIAVLRIDADWYASTRICLEHLFQKVVPGGFVVIDDYGAYDGCRKAVDEFLATLQAPVFLHAPNSEIRYWVKS